MTIIAGFKCPEGIVICADTEETASNLSKRNVPKLRFEPASIQHQENNGLAVAFCGAGDNGPFIDKIVENAWADAQVATSLDEACEEIEKSIKNTYSEFGKIYQPGYCPGADLVYGVKLHDSCRLFSAHDAIVTEKHTYDSGGAGYYMADFLASRMYKETLTLRQCVILAAYILFQAKEHVAGCGGDSHVAILRKNGQSGRVAGYVISRMTELSQFADEISGHFLLKTADLELTEQEFSNSVKSVLDITQKVREDNLKRLQEFRDGWTKTYQNLGLEKLERDEYGMSIVSDSKQLETKNK